MKNERRKACYHKYKERERKSIKDSERHNKKSMTDYGKQLERVNNNKTKLKKMNDNE